MTRPRAVVIGTKIGGVAEAVLASRGLVVHPPTGPIRGRLTAHTRRFLGIPYATPPTGRLR
jgi:hypothetical protein